MADAENLMDEIDLIVMHHIESIERIFDDLKLELAAAAATTAAAELSSSSANPNSMSERINTAQQR